MKKIRKIYSWIIISILFQVGVLVFINYYYLGNRAEVEAKLMTELGEKPKKVQKADIPTEAKEIKVSFDNSMLAYIKDGKIEIKNVKENKIIKTIDPKTDEISFYRWLPDRNMVIYALKARDNQTAWVQVITYNVVSEIDHAYPKITGIPSKSSISQIELSALTNVVYAKVLTGGNNAKLYKYDIMSNLSFVMNITDKTQIKELMYDNKLVYRDDKFRLFEWDGLKATSRQLKFEGKLEILGIAGIDDEIFAGILDENGKVRQILHGTLDKNMNDWAKMEVKAPTLAENIYISVDGNVYELVSEKSTVYNLKKGDKMAYSGKYVEIFSNHLITREGDSIKIENMEL